MLFFLVIFGVECVGRVFVVGLVVSVVKVGDFVINFDCENWV